MKASDLLYGKRKKGPGPQPRPTPVNPKFEDLDDFLSYLHVWIYAVSPFEPELDFQYAYDASIPEYAVAELDWVEISYNGTVLKVIDAKRQIEPERGQWVLDIEWINEQAGFADDFYGIGFDDLLASNNDIADDRLIELLAKDYPFEGTQLKAG